MKVRVEDEIISLDLKDGKLSVENYDVESEKIAFILGGGYGRGASAFLFALDSKLSTQTSLQDLLAGFSKDLKALRSNAKRNAKGFVFNYLVYSDLEEDRRMAINHGDLSLDEWRRLADDQSENIRDEVLLNPETPPEALETFWKKETLLAQSQRELSWMAEHLAGHKNTSHDLLRQTFFFDTPGVSMALANNPHTPSDILISLLTRHRMAASVLSRHDLTDDVVKEARKNKAIELIWAQSTRREKDHKTILQENDLELKIALSGNPNIDYRILKNLAADAEACVALAMKKKWKGEIKKRAEKNLATLLDLQFAEKISNEL